MVFNHIEEMRGTVLTLSDGPAGIFETLRLMRSIIDRAKLQPKMRARVAQLLTLVPQKDWLEEIGTLFDFAQNRIRYMSDIAGIETIAEPEQTIQIGAGDCDDKAVLLATMLEVAGYPTRLIATGYSYPGVFEHVYIAAMLPDGSFLPLDASEPHAPGWQASNPVTYWAEPK